MSLTEPMDNKLIMIIKSPFKLNFNSERQIEKNVSMRWGYQISNKAFEAKKQFSSFRESSPKISCQINPLKVNRSKLERSARLEQLQNEMQISMMGKKMDEMNEQNGSASLSLMQLLNNKIKEYNDLIDYKGLPIKKASSFVEKVEGYSKTEEVLNKITQSSKQMSRSISLNHTVKNSKAALQNYREFSYHIIKSERGRGRKQKCFQRSRRYYQKQENEACSLRFKKNDDLQHSDLNETVNMKEPYISAKESQATKRLRKQQRREKEIVKMWKHRIQSSKKEKQNSPSTSKEMTSGSQPTQSILSVPIIPQNKPLFRRKLRVSNTLSDNEKQILEMMIEEEDDAYYWTTCRNEKMNLLLKGKKHQ